MYCDVVGGLSYEFVIPLLSVLDQVEPLRLMFVIAPDPHRGTNDFQQHERHERRKRYGGTDRRALHKELCGIPIEESIPPRGIDGTRRKDPRHESSEDAPHAVNGESVERIVKVPFDPLVTRPVADARDSEPDDHR